ncbi:MAG: hypothetical protein KZQ95_01820 [Candidatus Thiodiazotropha sp. (ex Epidulcina cf. delphinae)]|nr:hypothetical protein [Candidatus Thiodiazotropha sp. (ex Epidulcina cf. delphinae)]
MVRVLIGLFIFTFSQFLWGEECRSVELLYITSDHGVEGQVDTNFDQRLAELGRSTSEKLFGVQRMRRYGALASKCYWDGNSVFEWGGFVDPNGTIVGHSDLGDVHVRQDTFGVFAVGGFRFRRAVASAGAYAAYTESDVHSWVLGRLALEEYHDTYHDFSTGLVVRLQVDLTDEIAGTCTMFRHVGDMDKIGASHIVGCGLRYQF